jgi:hypothetical protein
MRPAMRPGSPVLSLREVLEHVLNSTPDRRERAGFGQPGAATLREERSTGGTPAIAREKNHIPPDLDRGYLRPYDP